MLACSLSMLACSDFRCCLLEVELVTRPLLLAVFAALVLAQAGVCSPKGVVRSDALVTMHPDQVVCPLSETLFGTNVMPQDKANMTRPEVIERVKQMGIKSCRYPNGCIADQYNWKNPGPNMATVDEFLDFCDATGAEAYYTVNMQGGTEGLKGPSPTNLSLEEIIKYQHLAPNPCGYTNYHFGTLAETIEFVKKYTVDRALAGRRPILAYEMGNENWGQSRTDWTPIVYAKTIEVYARAIRGVLEDAKKTHPELAKYSLYIVAVGYPVMGNNMKMVDSPDRTINVAWTKGLNQLHRQGLVDAVQEHYYPYGSANGGTLVWVAHNLRNIIDTRKSIPNERLNGYRDPEIAYEMPMEHTEWNVKCWGPTFKENVQLTNGGFENGLAGWTISGERAAVVSWAARRGAKGLRITAADKAKPCEISQTFDCPDKVKTFVAGVWVRTDKPGAVKILLKQASDGENKDKVIGGWDAKLSNMWERVIASANLKPDTKSLRLVLQVSAPATVYLDEAKLYNTSESSGHCPISAGVFEQDLFSVDALREMAVGGCPRAHIHHIMGDYNCGQMTSKGEIKDLGRAFQFFTGAYGDRIVNTTCKTESFGYYTGGNAWATDFNALAPDRNDIPMLAAMTSRKDNTLYVLLINRTSDRTIDAKIDLGVDPANGTANVRTLMGTDIEVPGASISESTVKVARTFTQAVEPYSAQILSVRLKR